MSDSNPFDDQNFGTDLAKPSAKPEKNVFDDADYGAKTGIARSIADSAVSLASGALTGGQLIANAAGADNSVAQGFGDAAKFVGGFKSGGRRAEQDARGQKIQDAEASGSTWEEVKANVGAFAEAPIDTTLEAVGTSAPTIAAAIATRGKVNGLGAGVGAVQGAGTVKGSIYEAVEQKYLEAGATPEEAKARAIEAQSYNGENASQIGIGAGLGLVAGSTGIEGAVGRIAGREMGEQAAQGLVKSTLKGAALEAPIEAAQGGQERLAANLALQNEGFDTPTWQGVAGSAALEGVAGAAGGGAFGAAESLMAGSPVQADPLTDTAPQPGSVTPDVPAPEAPIQAAGEPLSPLPDVAPAPTQSERMGIDPNAGPMSSAAALAVDSGASEQLAQQSALEQAAALAQKGGNAASEGAIDPATGEVLQGEAQPDRAAELKERIDYVQKQAKVSGWDQRLMEERESALAELAALQPQEKAVEAASQALAAGGNEADASRAATDSLIGDMEKSPGISIASDAPAAVAAAVEKAKAPAAAPGSQDPRFGLEPPKSVKEGIELARKKKAAEKAKESLHSAIYTPESKVTLADIQALPDSEIERLGAMLSRAQENHDQLGTASTESALSFAKDAIRSSVSSQSLAATVEGMKAKNAAPITAPAERSDGSTETVGDSGLVIVHGSGNPALTVDDVEIVRANGQKQGKKGRLYGGLYGTEEADAAQAEDYAKASGGEGGVFDVSIKPGTRVLNKTGDVTRLSKDYIDELVSQGYGVVKGTDPRGRTEVVVIDKNAIASLGKRAAKAPSSAQEGIEQVRTEKAVDIKAITAKQIPDMTDAELQLAADHYGPEHKRTAKLNKEIAKRGVATQNPQLEIQADAQQATETEQASPQRAQAPGAQPAPAAEAEGSSEAAVAAAAQPPVVAESTVRAARKASIEEGGKGWLRMTQAEREALADRVDVKPVIRKNLPRAKWDDLNVDIQLKLAGQMGVTPSAQAEAPAAESGKEDAITANHKKAVEQKRRLTPPTREQVAEAESIGLVDADKYRTIGALEDGMGMQRKRNSQSIEGKDIDGNWSEFSKESGTQGVPRAEMPQIKAEHRGAMVNFLNARGIEHQEDTVPSASLKPTQAEFSREKVAKAKAYQGGNRSILVSGDGHVLDGHHQWMAAREKGEDVKVIRLNAPITDLLTAAREFPSSTTDAGGEQEATYSRRIVRTYTTQSGKVGAEVRESRNSDGKITYSHAGEWGAGSGQSEKDMLAIESDWKSSKRGFTVSTPDGAPKSTSVAVRSIRAKKALADALAPLNFTNNQGSGVNTTSAEGFGRRTSTSVRVIVDGENIQYQVNDTREQADGGRMKAYGPATQDVFDTQDDAVATAEKYKAANQVWVRRDDRPKPGDTDYSLAMAREDLSIMQGQPGSGGMVTDSRLAERIARQEKLIDEMQAAEFAPSAEQRQAAKQAGLDQASKISTWKVKPSAQAQVKAAILDSLASSLPGAHLDSARALGDEIYSEILATPDAATAEPAVTDDDIDNMFDTVLAELAPKAEQEAAPAEEASPAEVESLEDELRAQKKRVMRLKGGDATKLKAAEARLRRMRTGIFEAEDKLVPAARAGDEKALQQLEEMGYADTADAVRAFLPTPERSAGKALGSAVKNAGSALDEAINGLGALFGGGGKLSSGLTFDEDTYAKAKPMFISAAANVKAATKDLADVMRAVVGMVIDRFGVETAQNMKPYVSRFVKEVRDGKVNLESSNERTAIRDDGQEALGDVATQEGGAVEGGRRPGVDAADSGQAGDGASAGADATGVPATRSGGSGKGGADSAKSGKRSKSGAVGRGGKRQPGTAVSENDGLTVEVNGEQVSHSNVPAANFAITADTQLGKGGEVQKFNDNLAAIRVVKQLDRDNRRATPEEQALLARYVGWGGLASAFPDPSSGKFKDKWADRGTELRDLLTPEEYAAARQSTRNAHYTSETVVSAIWKAVTRLGFKGGMVLESSMGTGNFLGLAPQNIPARFVGVEYDGLTARIASALYPQATVLHSGFHKVPMADNAFALNIGNPPFGSESLRFQFKPELAGKSIHNQFFLAGMDALRPGGIQSMVVSRYLLDAQDKSTRLALARQAKLVGAIRLPDTAFKENARTEVVTDIIFLQKLTPSEQIAASAAVDAYMQKSATNPGLEKERRELAARVPAWVESKKVPDPLGGEDMNVNGYFAEHPEHIMGVLERSGSMQHGNDITVRLDNPAELESRLDAAIATLPENIQQLDSDVLAATEARFKSMSDALRIAVGNEEVGHLKIDQDGKLQRVIERETPEGDYEYSRQEITPESPWSDQLSQDANGNWYRLEVQVGEDGKNLKVLNADGKPTNRNVYSRTTFASEADVPDSLRLGKTSYARLTDLVKLRDLLKRQLVLETSDAAKGVMEGNRKALAAAYDAFVAEHGPVNRPVNLRLAMTMPDGGLTAAVEVGYQPARSAAQAARSGLEVQDEKATPAPILRGRVVPKYEPASKASTPSDALAITLAETGRVNIDRIADLLSITPEEAASQLQAGSDPLVFQDPETQQWETADAYLSGMVKRKLEAAKAAGMAVNVEALERIIPEDWTAENVAVQLGSTWVPSQYYADYLEQLSGGKARVSFSGMTNAFSVNLTNEGPQASEWSTEGAPVSYIVGRLLNSQPVVVTYTDFEGVTRVDREKTALAGLKAREIASDFGDWIFRDGDRRNDLVKLFNEQFNTRVVRQFNGQHLQLPGKVPDSIIKMRRHQLNAIWRGIYERFMLMDHTVGAGKTFTAIARAMERRRMGLSQKPMIVVPNHLVEQWEADVYRLYPGAKVLAAGKKDFEAKNRRRLFGKIATGDWDIVIVPHSSFGFIGIAPDTEARFLQAELASAQEAIEAAWEQAEEDGNDTGRRKPFGVKEAERLLTTLQNRMDAISAGAKDRQLTFEQLGIDDLTVDEAHEFKNLAYSSRLTGVRGMGDKSGSRKANDLYNKVRVLTESPTSTVTFLTGTPISNSAVEMFTVLRYLAAQSLEEMGMTHFDAFRAQFVEATAAFEPTESGRLKEVTRLGRTWSNMRSLMDLYYQVTDAVSLDDIKQWYAEDNGGADFPVPKVKGGKDRELVAIKPTAAQETMLQVIMDGFDGLDGIQDPDERNAERLRLMDRARKLSLDVRAVDPTSTSKEKGGKLEVAADNIKRIYDQWDAENGTQLVFLDRSVPKAKGDDKVIKAYDELLEKRDAAIAKNDEKALEEITEELDKYDAQEITELRAAQNDGWNGYQQLKDNLIAQGIPANEIRFIQEANNDEQKAAMFDAVRGGKVRVLIGSTPRMGAGTNVQDRIVALHHIDVTWKPSDIEQREGRAIRQGNLFATPGSELFREGFEVEIMAYATERTVDAKMWDLNATKLRTINGIRKYDGAFSMEFEDAEAVGMAEMAALASGNPLLLERVKLDSQIGNLELQERAFRRKMYAIKDQLDTARKNLERNPSLIERATQRQADAQQSIDKAARAKLARTVTIEGEVFNTLSEASRAVEDAVKLQQDGNEKARYAVNIDGKRVTSKDGIVEAIGSALGDSAPFEATINGNATGQRTVAARAIAEQLNALGAGDQSVTLGEVFGYTLSADVTYYKQLGTDFKEVSLTLEKDGATFVSASSREVAADDAFVPANVRSPLDRLVERLSAIATTDEAGHLRRQISSAKRDIPDLEARVGNGFTGADELNEKRKRLAEVVSELEGKAPALAEAAAATDYASTAIPATSQAAGGRMPPIDSRVAFSFAGRAAQGADLMALATAKERIAAGWGAESVRKDTGWSRGADGKWRFEISDDQARLAAKGDTAQAVLNNARLNAVEDGRSEVVASDVLDHPQLFAAYPELASVPITVTPVGVTAQARLRYVKGKPHIMVKGTMPASRLPSSLLHELQHAIQRKEGYATGGSKDSLVSDLDPTGVNTYRRLAGEVEARNTQTRQRMTPAMRREIDPQESADTAADQVIITFNGRDMTDLAAPKNAGRPALSEKALVRAFNLQFPKLAPAVSKMLARGKKGEKGGVVILSDADPLAIAGAFSRKTGRPLSESVQMFGDAGKVNGFYDPRSGLTFLVGPNLDPVTGPAVLLHEMAHGQQKQKIDQRAADMLMNRGKVKSADLRTFLDRVANRMIDAGETANAQEAAAYIVEQAVIEGRSQGYALADSRFLGWVDSALGKQVGDFLRSVLANIRQFMLRNGMPIGEVTVDDLVQYAMAGVEQAAAGDVQSSADLSFSRSGVRDLANKATAEFNRTFSAPGKLSFWHKTVGTMYNLAERSPEFKPVFKHAQGFIDDVAHYAADASEHAPTLLPRLETWKDITKSAIKAEDNKAIAKPIFEGTLLWARDENGKAVLVDTLANAASMLSTERKAEILLAQGKVPEGILKAWRGTGEARFKQMIDSRYETHMLKPGVIWSDAELTSLFNLTAPQIAMYREFREATDRSLDTMTRAQMIRLAGKDAKEIREAVMDAADAREGAKIIRNHLGQLASLNPDRETQLLAMAQSVQQALEQMQKVQGEGYAPLMRFGKFTVYVQSPSGESVYFGMFETAREANAMAASMRELYPTDIVTQGTKGEDMFKMFAGVNPETAELFGKFMDLDSTGDDARDKAFQEWLRITKNNRSAMKRLIHRKGISGYNEDVGRVLASFVYSNSRNTSAGLNMGDLSEAVAAIPKEQGELQDVAVALAEYIKNPQEEAQAIRGLLFAQYLGGSVASAFVNMTQPFAVSFPWLSQYGGAGKAAKALGLAAKNMSTRGYKYEADLAEALKKAEDDGIVSPQEVHQLMAQARGSGSLRAGDGTRIGDARALASNSVARMSVAWGKLFGSAEQVNRRITYIAAYRMAKAQGMASADEFARHAVTETQFVYSKASKMKWGRGAVGGTLMTFKTYSIAYVELMHRLWNQGEPGSAERADGRKAAALMIATLLLMGGAGGLPFAEDLEDLIDGAGQLMGYNLSSKKVKEQFLMDVFGEALGSFIDKGVTGIPGSPVDVSGRLGMGNLIPGTGLFLDRPDNSRDIMELAGPAGDFAKRIFTGGKELLKGNVGKAALEVSPTAVRNAAKGVDMAVTGMYRDTKGYKVLDATLLESALKGVGFQPGGVAKIQEANYINQRSKAFYSQQAQNIRAQWAAGIFEGDPSKVQAARDALAAWNAKNPEQRIIIRIPDVMRRVREMSLSKDERIAKTAPKAMRAQMMEDAARIRGQLAD